MGDDDEGGMAWAMVEGEEVAHNNQFFLQTLIMECTHPKIGSGFIHRSG